MDIARTAAFWDERHLTTTHHRKEWSIHPLAIARQITILDGMDSCQWLRTLYFPDRLVRRALGIGVGTAAAELRMLADGMVEHFDLYDVSRASLEKARTDARALGVEERARFLCEDINTVTLSGKTYDLVTFIASLHHMDRLEEMVRAVYHTLTPGGVLFAAEYVGPDRFDYPPEHVIFAQQLYAVLAPELKHPMLPVLQWPTPEEVIAADPTEAIHSSAIIETVERVFPRVEITPLYGTLPFMMFWSLNPDALYDTEQGRTLVQAILDFDTALVDSGRLPSYWAFIVAIKPNETATS